MTSKLPINLENLLRQRQVENGSAITVLMRDLHTGRTRVTLMLDQKEATA